MSSEPEQQQQHQGDKDTPDEDVAQVIDLKYRYDADTAHKARNRCCGSRSKNTGIPEEDAGAISRIWFYWARYLFQRASYLHKVHHTALEQDDLLPLPTQDHGSVIDPIFENAWDELGRQEEQQEHERLLKQQQQDERDNDKGKKKKSTSTSAAATASMTLDTMHSANAELQTTRIRRALQAVLGRQFVIAGFIKAINTGLQFGFPLILNEILKFIEQTQSGEITSDDPGYVQYKGYWLSALLFVFMALKAVTENAYFHKVYRAGYNARVAVSTAVYSKALRLSNVERQSTTLGQLINLMQVDATKIEMFIPQIHVLWDGLLQIIGYIAILYSLIGWPCFAGLVIMIAAGPLQGVIMRKLFAVNRSMTKFTDDRVKTTNEALMGIQCVKMYTWEDSFLNEINKYRTHELSLLKKAAYLRGASRSYMSALPGIVAVASFVVYALAIPDAQITASTLFAALVAFDQLRFPLLFYPMSLAQLAQAKVSAARVEIFLRMKEVVVGTATSSASTGTTSVAKTTNDDDDEAADAHCYERNENSPNGGEIIVENATVYWRDPTQPLLDDDVSSSLHGGGSSTRSLSVTEGDGDTDADIEQPTIRYPKAVLKDINLKVSSGELCAVIGPVASGKSTLCSAVLNETILGSGSRVVLNGTVAYVSQTAWILNATMRENILFGLPYDQEKYDRIIKACQLTYDLEMLDDGDMTEIGERGINLSGGQKQRVSVARAAYSEAQTIILDDPLSALDPEVAKKLFEECIVNLMKDRTRLLVTNQLQFIHSCDTIVALKHGRIIESGVFSDLMAIENGEVKKLLQQAEARMKERKPEEANEDSLPVDGIEATAGSGEKENATPSTTKDKKDAKSLVSKEERNIGAVSFSIYKKYIQEGGGACIFSFIYFLGLIGSLNQIAVTSWVSFWTSDATYERNSQAFYLGFYFMLAVTLGIFTFMRVLYLARFGIKAGDNLHSNLLNSILHAPMSWFDTTPIGRIVSRFSKDMYSIDMELVETADFFVFMSLQVVLSIATILFVTPWFGVTLPFLGFFYIKVLNYFREVARETKRIESISRSPVYAHFSETLGGLSTIRAYGQSERFQEEFDEKVDNNTRAYYNNKVADRWLSVRLESIGAMIAGLASIFAVQVAISDAISGKDMPDSFSSLAGLSLSFAISMTGMLNWCVRTFAQMESSMNAVERVLYYTEEIPQEAPYTTAGLKELANEPQNDDADADAATPPAIMAVKASGGETAKMSSDWPGEGEIVLNNLKMRYRDDTPLVLKGLTIRISPGERVGVVGRTGSGKSSLMLTLLRLVEPYIHIEGQTDYEAPLSLDGVDVLRIGLQELRSKIGIIPQHPVLFSGTIRSNMDPFDQYSDEQIWAALEQCGLQEKVMEMPGDLNAAVSEYGENLSAGTRQMLVLGRALLRQCRILLLDEATSSIDFATDQLIQRTIREAFPGSTVITIAHRINTILDSDKILVMKDGLAEEFGPPAELLDDEDSIFSDIVRHSKAGKEHID